MLEISRCCDCLRADSRGHPSERKPLSIDGGFFNNVPRVLMVLTAFQHVRRMVSGMHARMRTYIHLNTYIRTYKWDAHCWAAIYLFHDIWGLESDSALEAVESSPASQRIQLCTSNLGVRWHRSPRENLDHRDVVEQNDFDY